MERDPQQPGEIGGPNYGAVPMLGKYLVHQVGADKRLRRWTEHEYGLHKEGAERVVHCITMRYPWHVLLYILIPGIVFIGSCYLIMISIPLAQIVRWSNQGLLGGLAMLLTIVVLPTIMTVLISRYSKRTLRNKIHDHLTTPLCIYCGYDLSATNPSGDTATCTECGSITPVVLA